jgi:endoglucanase
MKEKRLIIALIGLVSLGYFFQGFASQQDMGVQLSKNISRWLVTARYMEGKCTPIFVKGWEGFPTQRCSYTVTDSATKTSKNGLVIMLNPSAEKLTTWIFSACKTYRPQINLTQCSNKLSNHIWIQSGAQFPIAGIVYEDNIPEDGIKEAYGFRNGVTTILEGVTHRSTRPLSQKQLEQALIARPLRTASHDAYARIVGVTRREYGLRNPKINVDGLNWLSVVKAAYQKAWNSDQNGLINAWLSAR